MAERMALGEKLEAFDNKAEAAVDYLIDWLTHEREYLVAIARGRHAHGHYLYGDTLMYEYGPDRLRAEASEELADAVVYVSRLLGLGDLPERS